MRVQLVRYVHNQAWLRRSRARTIAYEGHGGTRSLVFARLRSSSTLDALDVEGAQRWYIPGAG